MRAARAADALHAFAPPRQTRRRASAYSSSSDIAFDIHPPHHRPPARTPPPPAAPPHPSPARCPSFVIEHHHRPPHPHPPSSPSSSTQHHRHRRHRHRPIVHPPRRSFVGTATPRHAAERARQRADDATHCALPTPAAFARRRHCIAPHCRRRRRTFVGDIAPARTAALHCTFALHCNAALRIAHLPPARTPPPPPHCQHCNIPTRH